MKLVARGDCYIVTSLDGKEEFKFTDSITASGKLEDLGVLDSAIDEALKDLVLKQNQVAHFGYRGTFMFSEKLKGNK